MSAFRRAVLSVAPERLEQFTLEMKKNIGEKPAKKRKESRSRGKGSSSHPKKRRKSSDRKAKMKKKADTSSKGSADKPAGSKSENEKTSSSTPKDKEHGRTSSKRKMRGRGKVKDDSDIDTKDLDPSTPLPPLTDLVKNRAELLDTIFAIIKGPKLTSMLPDILKLMPLDDIKQLCHEQLDGMSSKRIVHILSGTNMESSSGTDSSDGEQPPLKKHSPKPSTVAHDHSLQTNFIDSTTEEPATTSKSMLFPSALTTAHSKMSSSEIPPKEVPNDNAAGQDAVSTSTEPNFIYSAGAESGTSDGEESEESSDPEEGEVHTSEDDMEKRPKVAPVVKGEEVFVEEVEVEEYEEESSRVGQTSPAYTKQKVAVKVFSKPSESINHLPKGDSAILEDAAEPDSPSTTDQDDSPDIDKAEAPKHEAAGDAARDAYAGKSQLEVLELELRARAIRSLMKAAQSGKLKPAGK